VEVDVCFATVTVEVEVDFKVEVDELPDGTEAMKEPRAQLAGAAIQLLSAVVSSPPWQLTLQ